MPNLQALYGRIKGDPNFALVVRQIREPFDHARVWAKGKNIALPLFDSGSRDESDDLLQLVDGNTLRNREVGSAFPTPYVLDRHGIVLFTHVGPLRDWLA
jgi:hypothetical protein